MKKIIKGIAFSTVFLFLFTTSNLNASDWSLYYQTPQNDRQEVDIKLPLKVIWQKRYIYTAPILMGGKLYLVETSKRLFGGYIQTILELDKKTGDVLKKYPVGEVDRLTYCRAIGYGNKLYISIAALDDRDWKNEKFNVYILAYDLSANKLIWNYHNVIEKESILTSDQGAWLNASDNKIILSVMEVRNHDKLYCFDADTGKLLWSTKEPKGVIDNTEPAIADGKVFLFTNNGPKMRGYLTAYDLNTGKTIWQKEFIVEKKDKYDQEKNDVWNMEKNISLTYKNGILYVPLTKNTRDGAFKLFDAKNGDELWSTEEHFKSFLTSTPLVDKDNCYLLEFERNIIKIDIGNKKVLWETPVSLYTHICLQTADYIAYSLNQNFRNFLVFISKDTGEEITRYEFPTRGAVTQLTQINDVLSDGNLLLVCLEDGNYFALEGNKQS